MERLPYVVRPPGSPDGTASAADLLPRPLLRRRRIRVHLPALLPRAGEARPRRERRLLPWHGPQGGRPLRRRRLRRGGERGGRLPLHARPAAHLVVRPSPERVREARRRG